ncbi:MAG: hypothetical protein ABI467_16480, partial [Kofleriaceae bacterium]
MIVTRQRRKTFPWKRLLFPLVALALIVIALWWTPSRNAIATGPLAPAWNAGGSAFDKVAAPFHFVAQNKVIADESATIAKLQQQVADLQTVAAAKDKQILRLQSSLDAANAQNAASRAPAAKPPAGSIPAAAPGAVANGAPGFAVGDLSAGASADARRTAANWAAMDPENAAKVVQKL